MDRRSSPFIAFCNAKRDEVKAANPTAQFGEMGRLLFTLWEGLTESEKAMYMAPSSCNVSVPANTSEPGLRRSSRLRNKRLGLNFWGSKM